MVHLLETTLVRVGNEEYAKANAHYGLTTLRSGHVSIQGDELRLAFVAKSGKPQSVRLHDARMARIVKQLHDMGGQRLFKYVQGGRLHYVESDDVNGYLREASRRPVTAKEFRTRMGSLLAATVLAESETPAGTRAARREAAKAIEIVASKLNNTKAVCKRSYVHPDVVELSVEGELPPLWAQGPVRDGRWLLREERKLLFVLTEGRRRVRRSHGVDSRAEAA